MTTDPQAFADQLIEDLRNPHYVHCPACGLLDRQFGVIKEGESWVCDKCGNRSPRSEFMPASTSSRWVVQRKGEEFSIIRLNNWHGRISYGWFDENKVLIAEIPENSSRTSITVILKVALLEADKRNKEEMQQTTNSP